jgi:hypothetical protein
MQTLRDNPFEVMVASQRVQTDNLSIEDAPTAPEVASQSLAQSGKALQSISIARDQPHGVVVEVKQCPEPIPFHFENPVWMGKGRQCAS